MNDMLQRFMQDENAKEMFLTGRAGTGKTTLLASAIPFLEDLGVDFTICAYTHKACQVLRDVLGDLDNIQTLHSYLNKRPNLNENALSHRNLETNIKCQDSERLSLIIIDEFSLVGEKDYVNLLEMYDSEDKSIRTIKVLFLGDLFQLQPVKDLQSIIPKKPYWIDLKKVHRTDKQDISDLMGDLVEAIETRKMPVIKQSENVKLSKDLVKDYLASENPSKKLMVWTNEKAQFYNSAIQGRELPIMGDIVAGPRSKEFRFDGMIDKVVNITTHNGESLTLKSKYKSLEFLLRMDNIVFCKLDGAPYAAIFGAHNYNQKKRLLSIKATTLNRTIKNASGMSAAEWTRKNDRHPLAVARKKAWRELLTFKDFVICIDFIHAITVHKSQGSTYEETFVDKTNIVDSPDKFRLLYVAMSRTSKKVTLA